MQTGLRIALSKGRIYQDTLPLLAAVGIEPRQDPETSRKLVLDTNEEDVKLILVRASDVPIYVQYGAADLGVAGKDVLLEHGGEGVYEPLDLGIARCRLAVAVPNGESLPTTGRLRIATKYVQATRRFFAARGQQVEIIKLYGSMELAPVVGLADAIVDVVDTGNTLKANGLTPVITIQEISSRLIVNKAAMKMKHQRVKTVIDAISAMLAERNSKAVVG